MRLRGILAALSAMLLLAGMFVAVHRGARGRGLAESMSQLSAHLEVADLRRGELRQEIERLRSRPRIVQAARELGLHEPSEDELVYLDLTRVSPRPAGGSS